MREVQTSSPAVAFAFGIYASPLGAVSGGPSTIGAMRQGGTGTVSMPAGRAGTQYCPSGFTLAVPTTLRTRVPPIVGMVAGKAGATKTNE